MPSAQGYISSIHSKPTSSDIKNVTFWHLIRMYQHIIVRILSSLLRRMSRCVRKIQGPTSIKDTSMQRHSHRLPIESNKRRTVKATYFFILTSYIFFLVYCMHSYIIDALRTLRNLNWGWIDILYHIYHMYHN